MVRQISYMKYTLHLFFLLLLFSSCIFGQEAEPVLEGLVSFVTSNNVYVKFVSTEAIRIGDHLELAGSNASCLLVKSKSSTSLVCSVVEGCSINKGDKVFYTPRITVEESETDETTLQENDKDMFRLAAAPPEVEETPDLYKEMIRGSISASSYSTLFSDRSDLHRIMTQFSLDAERLQLPFLSQCLCQLQADHR